MIIFLVIVSGQFIWINTFRDGESTSAIQKRLLKRFQGSEHPDDIFKDLFDNQDVAALNALPKVKEWVSMNQAIVDKKRRKREAEVWWSITNLYPWQAEMRKVNIDLTIFFLSITHF